MFLLLLLVLFFVSELCFLYIYKENNLHVKQNFVQFSSLGDLAISNEAHFIRHRTYADTFSIFAISPELLENFPSTFVYHYPTIQNTSKMYRE
ncbi:MAG: hypothetical protein IBX44_01925 [Sulfurospirillum sp.]|nr:hypothetical protein [Sulfurospirillum sp.]